MCISYSFAMPSSSFPCPVHTDLKENTNCDAGASTTTFGIRPQLWKIWIQEVAKPWDHQNGFFGLQLGHKMS